VFVCTTGKVFFTLLFYRSGAALAGFVVESQLSRQWQGADLYSQVFHNAEKSARTYQIVQSPVPEQSFYFFLPLPPPHPPFPLPFPTMHQVPKMVQ